MKVKLLTLILLLSLGSSLPADPLFPTATLRVVVDYNYPPYAFLDNEGNLVGIVADQWKAWSEETGIHVDLRGMPWSDAIALFEAGEADVLDTVFKTPAREKKYLFTRPYADIPVPIYIHKSISGIASLKDLVGFRVGVKDGDAAIETFYKFGITDLQPFPNYTDILEAAKNLEIRIFCIDGPPADYLLYKMELDKDFRIAFVLNHGQFHRAILRDKPGILRLVELGFNQIDNATIENIDRKWLGIEILKKVDFRIVGIVAAIVVVIVTILFLGVFLLRRRVYQATEELQKTALALRIEKSQFLRAEQLAGIGNWSLDLKVMLIRGSSGAQVIYGVEDRPLTLEDVQSCRLPEYKDLGNTALQNLITGTAPYSIEFKIKRVNDQEIRTIRSAAEFDRDKGIVFGVIQDITDQREVESALRKSIAEKEMLLREVHHRVKNNLQVITSILNLEQDQFSTEMSQIFEDTQARIRSMALVHEHLYRSTSLSQISLPEYIRDVANAAMEIYYKENITLNMDIASFEVSIDTATPLGLFTMEAITNAIRHGINGHASGTISIQVVLEDRPGYAKLIIKDSGQGFNEATDKAGLGSRLMEALASQLRGTLRKYNDQGAVVELVFRADPITPTN